MFCCLYYHEGFYHGDILKCVLKLNVKIKNTFNKHKIFSYKDTISIFFMFEKLFLTIFLPICLYTNRANKIANLDLKGKKAIPLKALL